MARLVVGMNISLDGYVDHDGFAPGPALFRHWIEATRSIAGSVYGRGLYELMAYWDGDEPSWTPDEREFAEAWRAQPKWVVSRTLESVGPNATLIRDNLESTLRALKAEIDGELDAGGPVLAQSLAELGLIDEYRLYYHPVALGRGRPFFLGPRPPLRLLASEVIAEDVVRLSYAPA